MRFPSYNCFLCIFGQHHCNYLGVQDIFMTEANLFCLADVIIIPSTSRLYLLISSAIWLVHPVSYIVWTFGVSMVIFSLVVRMVIGLVVSEESRLSPWAITTLLNEDPSTSREEFKCFKLFFLVSVVFYGMRLLTASPTFIFLPGTGTDINPRKTLGRLLHLCKRNIIKSWNGIR